MDDKSRRPAWCVAVQVKIVGNMIVAHSKNKMITISPKQGQHHDLRAIARIELRDLGYKRITDWKDNSAVFTKKR